MDDEAALEKLLRDQRLIRLPLVRAGARLTVGLSDKDWRAWFIEPDQ
jgi:arsenate reductase-like glutaredoxin family protein